MSRVSALETRRLHALPSEKAVDGFTMDAQHAADANGVEPPVVNQAPDRFRMDAELVRDIAHADQAVRISFRSRHFVSTYNRNRRIAALSSREEKEPSNFALILPSEPTRNVHGSPGKCH